MGTLLWSPTFVTDAKFALVRSYQWGFAIGWVDHSIISYGRSTVIEEHTYGGYRFHLTWKASFWPWGTFRNTLDYPFEDVYVTDPHSTTPSTAGTVLVSWKLDETFHVPMLVLTLAGSLGKYTIYKFPQAPPTYYGDRWPSTPSTPFHYG